MDTCSTLTLCLMSNQPRCRTVLFALQDLNNLSSGFFVNQLHPSPVGDPNFQFVVTHGCVSLEAT